jgi:hypothetical protein
MLDNLKNLNVEMLEEKDREIMRNLSVKYQNDLLKFEELKVASNRINQTPKQVRELKPIDNS